ncbi:MAG: phosphate import ATP-binding protein PstB [Pseudomonadota bacterium]|jgi:ABC-type phosphate transport system ATPase subunit
MSSARSAIIELKNYALQSGYSALLQGIELSVDAGESLGVVGPAGSGKSLLLKVISQSIWDRNISGLESPIQSGECKVFGEFFSDKKPSSASLSVLQRQMALVGDTSSWLPVSIAQNFEAVRIVSGLERIPFEDFVDSLPVSNRNKAQLLSVTELLASQVDQPILQQLAIIRAMLRKPRLLMLDEAFIRMDPVLVKNTEAILAEQSESLTLIIATNDLMQASRLTDRILFLLDGRVVECTPTTRFFTNPKTRQAESFIAGRDDSF